MAAISDKAIKKNTTSYKYNGGNELEEELNYYGTFYRKYDAQIGRFTGIDILSESTAGFSPFQFGNNNPVMFNDPTGAMPKEEFNNIVSTLLYTTGHGGTWSESEGINYFASEDEAFGYGASYMSANNLWGSQPGWATSFKGALQSFNQGKFTSVIRQSFQDGIEKQVRGMILDGHHWSAANAIIDYFNDVFTVDKSQYRIGVNPYGILGTTQERDEDGQFVVKLPTSLMDAFANGTAISGTNVILTFNDLARTIYHEAFVHMQQNLNANGFESPGGGLAGGAAREMEAYWRMFTDNIRIGPASTNFILNQWSLFINHATTDTGNNSIPSYQLMSSESQGNWAGAYYFMMHFVNLFKTK